MNDKDTIPDENAPPVLNDAQNQDDDLGSPEERARYKPPSPPHSYAPPKRELPGGAE